MTDNNGTKVHIETLHEGMGRLESSLKEFRGEVIRMLDKQDDKIKENTKARTRVKIYDYLVPILCAAIGYLFKGVL